MRVPLGWLSEWIDLPQSVEHLEDRLTMGGLEIEEILRTGPDLSGLRVGHVIEHSRHPDADRLSVCKVDLGDGEPLGIVCGAPNVAAGQKVAVATHGTILPGGVRVKRAKIRGVGSHGMICSDREMHLGDDQEGIRVLPPDAPVGAPLSDVLRCGETVFDVAITPNRGDWVSMLGIAREVRAHFGGAVRTPPTEVAEGERPASDDIRVEIEDRAGCHRYVARVVRGVEVGTSPEWLRERLEAAGLRSINAVVDVTNLVLLEFGQPLHAFDLAKLRGGVVRVRAAEEGEEIVTLDGQTRELRSEDLVIADAEGPIAIAGIMGGSESEVGEDTTDLLIESAHFHPSRVRRTARRLGLQTDASYRFERGVDREGAGRAAARAARLIQELAGGTVSRGAMEVLGEPPSLTGEIRLDPSRANRLLGTEISGEEMIELLSRLDIEATPAEDGSLVCCPPAYRNDLHLPADLIEEIARLHGYDRIPATLPEGVFSGVEVPPRRRLMLEVSQSLQSSGLTEVMTFPVARPDDPDALHLDPDDPRRRTVELLNPIQSTDSVLRTTLVPSLLRAAQANLRRQVEQLRMFEVSRVFLARQGSDLPEEPLQAVAVLSDAGEVSLWESRSVPIFFRAKGVGERLLADLGRPWTFRSGTGEPYLHPGAAGEFRVGEGSVAVVGELHPETAARFEIETPTAVLVVDLEALGRIPRQDPQYREVSYHPSVRRDLAVLLDRGTEAGEVLEAIRKTGGVALTSAELFDRWEGRGVPEGKVSLTFQLVFQRTDRSLTDSEVVKATDRVVNLLAHRFGGELR
jgi:phenylalanyl-tRNA synthetase beta chain